MTPERWQEVKKVLAGALERPPEQRTVYLDQACTDAYLRQEVESLIVAHEQGDSSFLEHATLTGEPLQKGSKLGQYTILARIGSGGMGEVYRARDTRLSRDVAIKVLPSFVSDDPDRLRRFEQEARAAAALDHPNILAVFQMGTYEGAPCLVSELLEGGTLREQLKRGPMPLRRLIDCGVQIARGLAAVHEKGIVHRDLKPENLFVTKDGRVKILDFGLAKLTQRQWAHESNAPTVGDLTEPGAVMGTVGYMSPEQVSGKAVDHRVDIFAFGAILYEMLTGKRAFHKPTSAETMTAILNEDPAAISQLVPTVPPALQRVVHRCLEKNPEQRFQSASDLAFALEALSDSSGSSAPIVAQPASRRIWVWAATALALVALGLATGGYFYFHRAPKLTEKDSIVVADFTNTTGDPVFDGTLRQGLSVQLEQTPFLQLVSDDHIAEILRLMEKPPETRLTHDVGREVCQRANATTVVEGSIATLGSQYVIGLDAVNCHTGDTLAQEQVAAAGKEKVLAALGNAASELRSKLGESAASLDTYNAPLDRLTSSSLHALQAWTIGTQALLKGDIPSAILSYQRAVTLDPTFAQAYSNLGVTYGFAADVDLAAKYTTKAYDLRGHVSEREQLSIIYNYHYFATGNWQKAAQVAEQWSKTFPRDPVAYIALEGTYRFDGPFDEGLAAARKLLQLDPTAYAYHTVGLNYLLLGRLDEAHATIQKGEANHIDPGAFRDLLYMIAFLQNDSGAMDTQLTGPWNFQPPAVADDAQSWTAASYGRLAHSREFLERAIVSARQHSTNNVAAEYQMSGAVIEALYGNFPEARKAVKDAASLSAAQQWGTDAAIVWALVGDTAQAQKIANDVSKRLPEATFVRFGALPTVQGLLALHRGKPSEATKALDVISSYELASPFNSSLPPMIPVYIRGETHLAAHQGQQAVADFQFILDHQGVLWSFPIGALAHLGLGRAYALQGDTVKARTAYQDFLTLWKDADPDIPILKQAKAEYAKLQ